MFKFILMLLAFVSFSALSVSELQIQKKECEPFNEKIAAQRSPTKLLENNAKKQLAQLSFKYDVLAYLNINNESRIIDIIPEIALPVDNGWLLSVHFSRTRGSGLVFKSHNGEIQNIIDDYIEDIYKFPHGYIVTAGVNIEGHSSGSIYLVTLKNKQYVAEKIHSLIAEPISSWLTSEDELVMSHRDGTSTIFTLDGSLFRVSCTAE